MSDTLFRDKRLPIVQRTKDGSYFHLNEDCYAWVKGSAIEITPEQFRAATRNEELETFDEEGYK